MLLVMGILGDHLSTMFALTKPYIYETNPFTLWLMSKGLWHLLDLFMIILGVMIPFLLIRLVKHPSLKGTLAYPVILGAIRLGACVWNLSLVI